MAAVTSIKEISVPKLTPMLAIELDDPFILKHASEGDHAFILPDHDAVIVEVLKVSYPEKHNAMDR